MPMYNLLKYSNNYSIPSWHLWGYSRDEMNDPSSEIVANHRVNKNKTTTNKSSGYKTKIPDNNTLDIEVAVP